MISQNNSKETTSHYDITLTNVTQEEVFCYSLPIIKGYVNALADGDCTHEKQTIVLRKLNSECDQTTQWPVINGNFKCLANLDVGNNEFVLEFKNSLLNFNIQFKSKKTSYHVLPVYIICDGHDGRFQAPENEDNSPASACRRIALGSKLIQSFTAEKLFESNMGRRTFQLAGDMNINLGCVVFHSRLTPEEVYSMEPEEIWKHFGRELMSSRYGSDKCKFLAFLSCTIYRPTEKEPQTYEEVVSQMKGHIALGGGSLAIFGTGCLHTWPETISEVLPRFLDETKIDKNRFMDDSCYRGTYGSCFSTTLGSVCHELGHAFDLGHSKKGIMARGFDNINLVFTIGNHSKESNKNVTTRSESQHSTVSFTRNLNITYRMSSPIKRPRNRQELRPINPPKLVEDELQYKTLNVKPCNETCNEKKKNFRNSKILIDDLTFWDKSCSVLLKYHRWFVNNDPDHQQSSIEFDPTRNTISSACGIRVIELRNDDGLVLASWEFLNTYLPKKFTIPLQNNNLQNVHMIVAEDSAGNILKRTV